MGGEWNDTMQDAIVTSDGGILIVGGTNARFHGKRTANIYLLRTDLSGELLWEETYGEGDGYLYGRVVRQTDGGGILISGVKSSADTAGQDIFVLQLDQERNEVWIKTFGGPLDEFGAAWPLDDGGYLLGGNIVDPDDIVADPSTPGYGGFAGRSNLYLAKVDAAGNEIWSRSFGGDNNVLVSSVAPTPDGGFIILGNILHFPEGGDEIYMVKVDADGNDVWSRTWDEGSMSGCDLIETSDGNYLISGSSIDHGDDQADLSADFLFIKVDPEGNEIWLSTFGDPDKTDRADVVVETADGGFVAVGDCVSDSRTRVAEITMVKIDRNGQLLWQNVIETNTHNMYATLLEHPDGGFVIAGSTLISRQLDLLLIKTDAEGQVHN